MTPSLTPEQMEEAVEAAFQGALKRVEERTGEPVIRSDVNDRRAKDSLRAALDAALPAIIGAVLERAAQHLRDVVREGDYDDDTASGIEEAWLLIEALAKEPR